MSEKSKLLVFDKKEIFLIFLFMLLSATLSFVFGVKVGKSYSYKEAGLTPQDRIDMDLKSEIEENVDKIAEQDEKPAAGEAPVNKDWGHKKLEEEFERLDEKPEAVEESTPAPAVTAKPANANKAAAGGDLRAQYKGKYTIQLGSHRTLDEAKNFASGFKVLGYSPIINEVDIDGKGVWYRVSLGAFDSVAASKEYIVKEETLFSGKDYVIVRID